MENPKITDEMTFHHRRRVEAHIASVEENAARLLGGNKNANMEFPLVLTRTQVLTHDSDKDWGGENWDGYVLIDWMYREKKNGREFPYTESMKMATRRHCSSNMHHPEAWDPRYDSQFELFDSGKNRDGLTGTPVNATSMGVSYLAEMVCDWKATADERGNSAWAWYRTVVPHRFLFTDAQKEAIEEFLTVLEGEEIRYSKLTQNDRLSERP